MHRSFLSDNSLSFRFVAICGVLWLSFCGVFLQHVRRHRQEAARAEEP
jgi:hypothetical protein